MLLLSLTTARFAREGKWKFMLGGQNQRFPVRNNKKLGDWGRAPVNGRQLFHFIFSLLQGTCCSENNVPTGLPKRNWRQPSQEKRHEGTKRDGNFTYCPPKANRKNKGKRSPKNSLCGIYQTQPRDAPPERLRSDLPNCERHGHRRGAHQRGPPGAERRLCEAPWTMKAHPDQCNCSAISRTPVCFSARF